MKLDFDFHDLSEQEVIALFFSRLDSYERIYKFGPVLKVTDKTFPDCFIMHGKKKVGIEFETKATNFKSHNHFNDPNLSKCQFVFCYEDDSNDDLKKEFAHHKIKVKKIIIPRYNFVKGEEWDKAIKFLNDHERFTNQEFKKVNKTHIWRLLEEGKIVQLWRGKYKSLCYQEKS